MQQLSPLPFTSLLVNCLVWTLYGYLRKDNTVLVPNIIGILSGSVSVLSYHMYAPKSPGRLYMAGAIIVFFAVKCALSGDYNSIGILGCSLAVVLRYTSPHQSHYCHVIVF